MIIFCIIQRKVTESYHGSHLIFTPTGGSGCYSSVGRDKLGRGQYINLGSSECLAIGTIIHETLHSLGWELNCCSYVMVVHYLGGTHEHMRWDRDGFVKILRQNLLPEAERNFDTKSGDAFSTFGTPFDYDSVMHDAVLNMAAQVPQDLSP